MRGANASGYAAATRPARRGVAQTMTGIVFRCAAIGLISLAFPAIALADNGGDHADGWGEVGAAATAAAGAAAVAAAGGAATRARSALRPTPCPMTGWPR